MAHDLVAVTASLYDFLVDSEAPLAARTVTFEAARARVTERAQRLVAAFAEVRDRVAAPLAQRIDDAAEALRELAAELRQHAPAPAQLKRLWHGLGARYEALRAHLPSARPGADVQLAALKPKNLARNLFHVGMALTGVLSYRFLLDRTGAIVVTGTIFALFVALELLRRRSAAWNRRFSDKLFKAIIRPGEVHRVPAATWYIAALFLSCVLFPQLAVEVGALVLGFGDPLAHLVGKRFGKRKLVGDKSVVGTLAFVAGAGLAAFVFVALVGLAPGLALAIALCAAVAGAAAELFAGRLDDNFTIPLVAGLAVVPFIA